MASYVVNASTKDEILQSILDIFMFLQRKFYTEDKNVPQTANI